MDPDFIRYQEALAKTTARSRSLGALPIMLVFVVAVVVICLMTQSLGGDPPGSIPIDSSVAQRLPVLGTWMVTEAHESEVKVGDRIVIAHDKFSIAGREVRIRTWERKREKHGLELYTAWIADGDDFFIVAHTADGRVSVGLQTDIVSVKRIP